MGRVPKATAIAIELDGKAEVLAELNLGSMWNRMMGEALDLFAQADRQGKSPAEIAAEVDRFLADLSPKYEAALARGDVTVAYNEGRATEGTLMAEEGRATFAVRSEVLDDRSCEPCHEWDGFVVEIDSPEFDAVMPPSYCDGGDNCRGFYIILDDSIDAASLNR